MPVTNYSVTNYSNYWIRIAIGLGLAALLLSAAAGIAGAGEEKTEEAIFAGGCFWCVESDFEKLSGVKEVISGYTGGESQNPTYHDYSKAGHIEAVRVLYDPGLISYEELLEYFWHHVDPTDAGGQFCDRGHAYTTAIFALDDQQRRLAEESKAALQASGRLKDPVVTPVLTAGPFYRAEEYHQGYYKKNPLRYKFYRFGCGRDKRVKEVWGINK